MENIESLVVGGEKLTTIFGYWPSFHDAEVRELHFWRGNIQPEKGVYDFPVLTLKIHLWELTNAVNSAGYLIRLHHTLTTIKFRGVADFEMQGFNHQNALMGVSITHEVGTEGPSPYFGVELSPAFGMGASFECLGIEVVDAVSCAVSGDINSGIDS